MERLLPNLASVITNESGCAGLAVLPPAWLTCCRKLIAYFLLGMPLLIASCFRSSTQLILSYSSLQLIPQFLHTIQYGISLSPSRSLRLSVDHCVKCLAIPLPPTVIIVNVIAVVYLPCWKCGSVPEKFVT